MVKFFMLLYSVSLFYGTNTELVHSEAESEAISHVTPSSYAYAEAASEYESPTERDLKTTEGATTEDCHNKTEVNVDNIKGALNCSLPNESLICVRFCPPLRTCENRNERYHCPLISLNANCTYKCACNTGFYRNADGYCVTSDLCDKKCNGPNEVYKPDKKTCPLELCPSRISVIRYACNPKEVGQPGCACKPGFRRLNLDSTCIPIDQCPGRSKLPPICSLPNESAKCVTSCPPPKTCQNRKILYRCADNTNETCKFQCVCDGGFFRASDGSCVPANLCDMKCTGPNEEYKPDKKTCPPETCKSIVSRYACDPKEIGQPGCVCKSGFLRLSLNSTCIPTKDCPELANQPPECSLPNESLKCLTSCPRPRTCINRNIRYKCPNNANKICKLECVCNDGFYRNSDGFCVTYDLCDEKCNGTNEVYKPDKKTCPLELCPSRISVIHYACNPKEVGQPGCTCKPGFRRLNLNLTCIPIEQCPGQGNQNDTCGDDEIYNKCPSESCEYCPKNDQEARKCVTSSSSLVNCPPAKCTCRYNYKRLLNGTCVPTRDCPPFRCSRPNEQFDACPLCPSDDCERATPNGDCPRIGRIGIPLLCRPSCRCVKDYWRNGDHCVPYEECPSIINKKCSGPNEVYKSDKKKCPPETCQSMLALYKCDSKEKSQPGCVCKPGYLRLNSSSTCIPTSDCPQTNEPSEDCLSE